MYVTTCHKCEIDSLKLYKEASNSLSNSMFECDRGYLVTYPPQVRDSKAAAVCAHGGSILISEDEVCFLSCLSYKPGLLLLLFTPLESAQLQESPFLICLARYKLWIRKTWAFFFFECTHSMIKAAASGNSLCFGGRKHFWALAPSDTLGSPLWYDIFPWQLQSRTLRAPVLYIRDLGSGNEPSWYNPEKWRDSWIGLWVSLTRV